MRKLSKLLAAALGAALLLSCLTPALASAPAAGSNVLFDLMLMVDDTKSMRTNDSNRLAADSLRRFVDLLPSTGSRMGIASYSAPDVSTGFNGIIHEQEIIPVEDDASRNLLKSFSLDQNGSFTDLPSALAYAVEKLTAVKQDGVTQAIVALSDGENDFSIRDTNITDALTQSRLQTVYTSKIPVYLVFINVNNANVETAMEEIAAKSGGKAYFLKDNTEIDTTLQEIQEKVAGLKPNPGISIPLEPDKPYSWKFPIEDNVFEANLLLTHANIPLEVELLDPNGQVMPMGVNGVGKTLTADAANNTARTTIKILKPEKGNYTLNMTSKSYPQLVETQIILNQEIFVQVTLDCAGASTVGADIQAAPGDKVTVTAALMRGQEIYTDLDFSNMTAQLEFNGQTYPMSRVSDIFTCDVTAPTANGNYPLVVTVSGDRNFSSSSTPIAIVVGSGPAPAPSGNLFVQVALASGGANAVGGDIQAAPGEKVAVTASLMQGLQKFSDPSLAAMTAQAEVNGQTYPMTLSGDSFLCDVPAPDAAGSYPLVVTVSDGQNSYQNTPVNINVGGGGLPLWAIILIVVVVLAGVAVLVIFLVKRGGGSGGGKRNYGYTQLRGTLQVSYYQPGHLYMWEKFVQPGAYYSKQQPQAPLGKMLRDLQDYGEVPAYFDAITVAGLQYGTGQQYVEVKGSLGPDPSQQVDLRLEVNTGMQQSEFDSFGDEGMAVIHFPDGAEAELKFSLI